MKANVHQGKRKTPITMPASFRRVACRASNSRYRSTPSAKEFQVSVKYRLGTAVYDQERKCPYCKSGTLDTFGDHAVACYGRGDAISRHDRIRYCMAFACTAANLSPVIEKRNLIAENISRLGDIYMLSWKSGQSAALDITVTSSLKRNIISHAAEKTG